MALSTTLLFLASLSLPIQLNKFFWPDYSYILGLPIDYRAASIYLSEILILLFIVAFFIQNIGNLKKIYSENREVIKILTVFNSYLFISSLFFSSTQLASQIFNFRILALSFFFIFAANILKRNEIRKKLTKVIAFSVSWQFALVIYQIISQKSLGVWFLGERDFDAGTVLIAHFNLFGIQILRPYGTFPHPNALAAFFAISLLFLISLKKHLIIPLSFAILGGLLTFSKSFILSIVFSLAPFILKARYLMFLPLVSILIWLIAAYTFHFQIASFSERLMLITASLNISSKNLFFGVGSNNFIEQLAKLNLFSISEIRLLQPVHNVFFLILAENGLIGLLIFLFFLLSIGRKLKRPNHLAIFLTLMIFASLDHFFWTLAQGRFLFFLALAYIASSPKEMGT